MRSTGLSQKKEQGWHIPAEEVTSSNTPSPWSSGHCFLCLGMRKSQNWGGLTMETTSQLKTFLRMASIFHTSCAKSTSSWPKLWLNVSMVGLWLWIRLVEKWLTCPNESSRGASHQPPEILSGWDTYKAFDIKIWGNFQRRAFIFSMPKDSAHQFRFKVKNSGR